MNRFFKGPSFIKVFLEFAVVSEEVVYGVINSQADGYAGYQTGSYRQRDPQPAHNTEIDDDRKAVGNHSYKTNLVRQKKQKHDAKDKDQRQRKALHLAFGYEITALGDHNAYSGNLKGEVF